MTLRRKLVFGLVLAPLVATGCATHHPHHATRKAPSYRPSWAVSLGRDVGPIAFDDHRLVVPTSSAGQGDWDSLISIEVASADASGPRKVVATTAFAHGLINWAAAVGDWTVYVDQSARQSDEAHDVLWRVVAVDPQGVRHVLATNGDRPDPFVPVLQGGQGYAFWSLAEADRTAREQIWRPGWPTPRDVARHAVLGPGSEHLDGDAITYVGPPAGARPDVPGPADCWRLPVEGGPPVAVTRTGLVMECAADGDRLVWTEHGDPSDTSLETEEVGDDPYELWLEIRGHQPVLLHRGPMGWGRPCLVGGVVIWTSSEGRSVVTDLEDHRSRTLPGRVEGTFVSDGSLLTRVVVRGNQNVAEIYRAADLGAGTGSSD